MRVSVTTAVRGFVVLVSLTARWASAEPPATGPATEKRFPPLQVPEGFKATLFACDPLIEYPSVIAAGPRAGSLFIAADFMTGLGTEIVRRDEIRRIEDTDGDGYADQSTVVADGFNSIQGLAFHDGALFVMHAPFLSVVRGWQEGKAERKDLLTGLGLPPEMDQIRLHNANGVVPGHDGWLYLALGDRGCDVQRPEGDRLVLNGGGILRCRPEGRDLHVFATGLRNIYDVALDEALNVFVRDNENDGGDYKIRLCHSFFGADHGYPYQYYERPAETLSPLADLGLGSAAGGVCYLEPQFPAEYRGNLFFCEWGRAVVRYRPERTQSTFGPVKEIDFAFGAANDPYGFKPTDIVVARDGTMFVSDWADGQRPRRGRGRIYRIQSANPGPPTPVENGLNSASYWTRCETQDALERRGAEGLKSVDAALSAKQLGVAGRLHAVWLVARLGGTSAVERLFSLAEQDSDPIVQAQAVRAIADLADPDLVHHRLGAGSGDAELAQRLAKFAEGRAEPVLLETVLALGRLRWAGTPDFLRQPLQPLDRPLLHASQQTLRRVGNWPPVLKWLDEPTASVWRTLALQALAGQYDAAVVDGLISRLQTETDAGRRRELADVLARVYKRPGPWEYWMYRPPPRPANTVAWERTAAIEQALANYVADANRSDPAGTERLPVLKAMLREKIPVPTTTLANWLDSARTPELVAALLGALHASSDGSRLDAFESVVRRREHTVANRLAAVGYLSERLAAEQAEPLLLLAKATEAGPVQAELLRVIGKRRSPAMATAFLVDSLTSAHPTVRASAVGALAQFPLDAASLAATRAGVEKLLHDPESAVREAAALSAGKLGVSATADRLLELARDADPAVRRASLSALRELKLQTSRATEVAIAALADPATTLAALELLAELGNAAQIEAVAEVARRQPSVETLAALGHVIQKWSSRPGLTPDERRTIERGLAEMHGRSAVFLGWYVRGPVDAKSADELSTALVADRELPVGANPSAGWRWVATRELVSRVPLGSASRPDDSWLAYGELTASADGPIELMTASTGLESVWLNGQLVFRRERPAAVGPYADRVDANLVAGHNRVLIRLSHVKDSAEFQLRLRRKTASAEQERLAMAALSRAGNPERGRQLFLNAEKSLCTKCHRVPGQDQGPRVGPDLTGLGSRFPKIYIVESLLEPSRAIAPSFETTVLEFANGKVLSGIVTAETERSLTLVDNQTKEHVLDKAELELRKKQFVSTMPEGFAKRFSEDEFVDLVSYLVNLKDTRGK